MELGKVAFLNHALGWQSLESQSNFIRDFHLTLNLNDRFFLVNEHL